MSVEVTTLKSGINVVTDTMPHLETASLGVWVGSGSRDERRDEHGISHFLEHMAFKGTRRRTARQIAEEIEAVGGDLNAATGAESTAYYARVLKAGRAAGARRACPTFCPSRPSTATRSLREQSVIVQEIGAVADTPDDLIFEHLQEIAFPDQPLGRSILGTADDGALVRRRRSCATISAAQLPRARTWSWPRPAPSTTKPWSPRSRSGFASSTARPARCRSRRNSAAAATSRSASSSRCTSRWRCPGVPQNDPSLYSLQVFTNVLGGGMSSRLFQEAREKRGLCYSIYSFHMPYSDVGMFGLYAGTDAADTSELMRRGRRRDRQRRRNHLRGGNRARQGADEGRLADGAGKLRRAYRTTRAADDDRGRPIPIEELVEKVEAVTVESARAAGRALIARGKPAIAVLGLGSGLESAAAIAETLTRQAA